MDRNWNPSQELAHFREIWEYRSPEHKTMHTQQLWDERADEWEYELTHDPVKSESTKRRVDATTHYLLQRGLLKSTDDVIDVGCGPGRFVAEFAKTAHCSYGSDISGRMLEYGAAFAKAQGLFNTNFVRADFNTADLDELGWRNRFDLVFTSITPAIGGKGNLEKLMEMSRGFCFNSCFIHFKDELLDEFLTRELGLPAWNELSNHWHWFYGLFNLLLLEGYSPETVYYDDCRNEVIPVTRDTAQRLSCHLTVPDGMTAQEMTSRFYEYMKKCASADGTIARNSTYTYGWILWDVRRRVVRAR